MSIEQENHLLVCVAVDMVLKQTINANSKGQLKVIMAFADISKAVNRWIVTASVKSKILHAVYRLCWHEYFL